KIADSLCDLTLDNPPQQQRMLQVRSLLQQRDQELRRLAADSSAKSAAESMFSSENLSLLSRLTLLVQTARAQERSLLTQRQQAQTSSTRNTYTILGLLALLLSGLLLYIYFVSSRSLRQRNQALLESKIAALELEKSNEALKHKRREADRANELKSEFLANMSHELRTPLNAISGFSELLSAEIAGPITEKQRRFLSHIETGAHHLLQLINDILDLSKIEAGQSELELRSLDPSLVLEEVLSGIRSLAMGKNIHLNSQCESGLALSADHIRLKQVLYNLLSNAVKFTPEGGRIEAKVFRQGESIRFEVSDTGRGISEEDQKIIFDEFRQAATPSDSTNEGTGLGLAISKKLVEKHGGSIGVVSAPGKGSLFYFLLPALAEESLPLPDREQTATASRRPQAEPRLSPLVLVVDDDVNACELVCNYLDSSGYRTATARSSADAIRLVGELQPDLITLDLLMPDGNGFGALYDLKSTYGSDLPPVIIVSVIDDRGAGLAMGAADYLVKPVSRNGLLNAIQKHLPVANANILVVDDDPAMLSLAAEVFSQPWVRLHGAGSGQQGLDIALSQQLDAIILDLVMPEMNGFEFLNAIRQHAHLSRLPIFILTARELSQAETQRLKSQVKSVFHKNSDWKSALLAQIAEGLENARGHRSEDGIGG
ncbi:MAG: ATP-binding response regulator, partial [Acidobacteriaceae bacterium]